MKDIESEIESIRWKVQQIGSRLKDLFQHPEYDQYAEEIKEYETEWYQLDSIVSNFPD